MQHMSPLLVRNKHDCLANMLALNIVCALACMRQCKLPCMNVWMRLAFQRAGGKSACALKLGPMRGVLRNWLAGNLQPRQQQHQDAAGFIQWQAAGSRVHIRVPTFAHWVPFSKDQNGFIHAAGACISQSVLCKTVRPSRCVIRNKAVQ